MFYSFYINCMLLFCMSLFSNKKHILFVQYSTVYSCFFIISIFSHNTIKIILCAFSDNGPYSLKSSNNDLQCNNNNKTINVNIDRSNLKLKLLHELRMEVLNKRLEQIMYHNRNQGK